MRKSEVYSWRLDVRRKMALEEAARAQHISVAVFLGRLVDRWIEESKSRDTEDEQERMFDAFQRSCGAIRGKDPTRSTRVRELVRAKLRRKHEASKPR